MTNAPTERLSHRAPSRGYLLAPLLFAVLPALALWFWWELGGPDRAVVYRVRTDRAMAQARLALLDYLALAHHRHQDAPLSRPGSLPCPDRPNRTGFGNLDGTQNSPCVGEHTWTRIGQLPWRAGYGCGSPVYRNGLGLDLRDGYGNRLWYAVSRNLVSPWLQSGPLNPARLYDPLYPWLSVYDAKQRLISDRIAAVVIAAGRPLRSQRRSGRALDEYCQPSRSREITDYLEAWESPFGIDHTQMSRCAADMDCHIQTKSLAFVRTPERSDFNDRVLYLTAEDKLQRAAWFANNTVQQALQHYRIRYGSLPYAAAPDPHASTCEKERYAGALPLPSCVRTAEAIVCRGPMGIQVVADEKAVAKNSEVPLIQRFQHQRGHCRVEGRRCSCVGEGACWGANARMHCHEAGVCATEVVGIARLILSPQRIAAGDRFDAASGGAEVQKEGKECQLPRAQARQSSCRLDSDCPHPPLSGLPDWFFENRWDRFIAYETAAHCTEGAEECAPSSSHAHLLSLVPTPVEAVLPSALFMSAVWPQIAPTSSGGHLKNRVFPQRSRWHDVSSSVDW